MQMDEVHSSRSVRVLEDPVLLHLLATIKQHQEPMCRLASLFMLNSLFRQSLVPRRATFCFSEGLLLVLMDILSKDFDPRDPNNDAQLYTLAAEIIWRFSSLPVSEQGPLISNGVIRGLVQFLRTDSKYYQFTPVVAEALERICGGRLFTEQEVRALPITPKILDNLKMYNQDVVKYSKVQHVYACKLSLQLPDEAKWISLADLFVREGYAWPMCQLQQKKLSPPTSPSSRPRSSPAKLPSPSSASPESPPLQTAISATSEKSIPSSKQSTVKSQSSPTSSHHEMVHDATEVKFLRAVGGNYFWAQIGADSIKSVNSVTQLLTMALPDLKNVAPKIGEVVAVRLEQADANVPQAIRGRLVDVQDAWVMIQSLDFGFTKIVKDSEIFGLTGTVACLTKFPPQAQICYLAGLQAPPADGAAVELALSACAQLTKLSPSATPMLHEVGMLGILPAFLQCGHLTIQLQATRTLANMAAVARVNKQSDLSVFIKPLLDVLANTPSHALTSQQRNLVVASVSALNNVVAFHAERRSVFLDHEGQLVILRVMMRHRSLIPICNSCAALLRNCYPGLVSSQGHKPGKALIRGDLRADLRADYSAFEKEDDHEQAADNSPLLQDQYNSSDDEHIDLMERMTQMQQLRVSSDDEEDDKADSEDTSPVLLAGEQSDSTILPVDGGIQSAIGLNAYEIHTTVPYRDDETHHIYKENRLSRISREHLAEIVCGMMNSGLGGSVYFGLTKDGQVQGIKLTRDERDEMRLGIDHLMTNCFVPPVFHNQLDIIYKPVFKRLENRQFATFVDLFVVEILIKASDSTIYNISKSGHCWHRFGPHTTKLSVQDVRQLITLDEEAKYKDEIRCLREELRNLKLKAK
ncbi:hypothetical protein BaRGS_00035031 [Batillaria attramentaria]|uniref:Schlafen AlbA-2 domain-containing protein n=1 Tax=Batillaria attramentaria TaxID=370345 RepID=A0ABD0JFM0_9CAEN